MTSTMLKTAARIQEMATKLAEELEAEQRKPDRFAVACLALATKAAKAGEHLRGGREAGPWTVALVEVLMWDLLYQPESGRPPRVEEAAAEEAARLIAWAAENPDALDMDDAHYFKVWAS
ncbi:hypothetical protein ABT352_33120 [Streptosporangium sp. NPDC000563]|uniref:hypothetical protein n=1 Tax=Streptosporangium sp. NPDC000563 TaxID=3154366 RepID=UPI0033189346